MSVGLVYDARFLNHRDPNWEHPECPERLVAVQAALAHSEVGERLTRRPPREATREEILRVHQAGYFDALAQSMPGKAGRLDPDTFYSEGSWEAALLAAGGLAELAVDVFRGEAGLRSGVALVRPPGHHAEADRGMGFCVFNNVAIAAEALRGAGAERVAILDWDVHHGNGTQHAFEARSDVLYLSSHRYPFYPGSGAAREIGQGAGEGFTVNVPLPAGCGDADYVAAFDQVFLPALRQFGPDVLLVSAGYDAHEADPLGGMGVSDHGFRILARKLRILADEISGGRLVAVLEGGYNVAALGRSVVALLEELVTDSPGDPEEIAAASGGPVAPVVEELRGRLGERLPR